MYYTFIPTPAGEVQLVGDSTTLFGLHWKVFARTPKIQPNWTKDDAVFAPVIAQINEYFAGTRQEFNITHKARGTSFQEQVWAELARIPFGRHTSYQQIAQAIGKPNAVRAVGTAVGSNPISIILPCHRVLTSTQKLGGYAGGLESKQVLLRREGITWRDAAGLVPAQLSIG